MEFMAMESMSILPQEKSCVGNTDGYLSHVDGLRAVAVLFVLLFHLDISVFRGGFIGVDVFFVISGFLITRMVLNEYKTTGKINFGKFYMRRIRRLIPAVLVTMILSTVIAVLLFSPSMLRHHGISMTAALFSISNWHFWRGSGYFDTMWEFEPLMHTWSLSVEEQFYLFWPALINIIASLEVPFSLVHGTLFLGGLILNISWVLLEFDTKAKSSLFFFTPFRVYEFVMGAQTVFLHQRDYSEHVRTVCVVSGLSLISLSALTFSESIFYPHAYALLPCFGTVLSILGGECKSARLILDNDICRYIGRISYSLYLYHWPLIIFFKYYLMRELNIQEKVILLLTSFAVASLSFYCVETPFRNSKLDAKPRSRLDRIIFVGFVVVLIAGLYLGFGPQLQFHSEIITAEDILNSKEKRHSLYQAGCNVTNWQDPSRCNVGSTKQLLVFGNSHEVDAFLSWQEMYGDNPDLNIVSYGLTNLCTYRFKGGVPSSSTKARECDRRTRALTRNSFIAKTDFIVYSALGHFGGGQKDQWSIIEWLMRKNPKIKLIIMGKYFVLTIPCSDLINRFNSFDACKLERFQSSNPFIDPISPQLPYLQKLNYLYINKTDLLCNGTLSSCMVEVDGEPATYDQHHMSLPFAKLLGQKILAKYQKRLQNLGLP